MHAECVVYLFRINTFFFFFCAGHKSRRRDYWFLIFIGECGYCPVLDVFNPPVKNEDLSVAINVNFLLGMVIAGVWSS